MSDTTRWTITLPAETAEALEMLAEESGTNRSQVINKLIGRGLAIEYLVEEGGIIIHRSPDGQDRVILQEIDKLNLKNYPPKNPF